MPRSLHVARSDSVPLSLLRLNLHSLNERAFICVHYSGGRKSSLHISLSLITLYNNSASGRLWHSFPSLVKYEWTWDTWFDVASVFNLQHFTNSLIIACSLPSLLWLSTCLVKQLAHQCLHINVCQNSSEGLLIRTQTSGPAGGTGEVHFSLLRCQALPEAAFCIFAFQTAVMLTSHPPPAWCDARWVTGEKYMTSPI